MAAVPAFPHNGCAWCTKALSDPNVCEACGRPQPLSGQEDHFAVFGLERRFGLDRAELERRFYRLSRALHPDRFTTGGMDLQRLSLDRMTLINQAYQVLRNPESRRGYLLELEGLKAATDAKSRIPVELAESWFELQDSLMEDPADAAAKLKAFQDELRVLQERSQGELERQEAEIDQALAREGVGAARPGLERLARSVQERSYLSSMERDIERLRSRVS